MYDISQTETFIGGSDVSHLFLSLGNLRLEIFYYYTVHHGNQSDRQFNILFFSLLCSSFCHYVLLLHSANLRC